jgi:hypothetical protein
MRIASLFLLMAMAAAYAAWLHGGLWLLLLWPAANCLVVAAACLLLADKATSADQALTMVAQARPRAHPSRAQRQAVEALARVLR